MTNLEHVEARQSTPEDDEISLLDLLEVIVDNLRLLVLGPLAAGLLALGITFAIPPTFTATTKFMPPQQQQSGAAAMLAGLGALGGLAGAAGGIKNPADQFIAFLKSRTVQDALVDKFNLTERYDTKSRENARTTLGTNAQIVSGKDGLIIIDASDKDPQFAADLANAHVEELGRLLNRLALTEAQQRRMFFEKQLSTAKDNLITAEQALKVSGVNSSTLKASPQAAVEGVAKLQAAIMSQEIKLASMRGYLTESAPDFKQAQTEMSALRVQLKQKEKDEPTDGRDGDYISKFRNFKYYETLLELFSKQYEVARLDESREGTTIQVLDYAQRPEKNSKPQRGVIVVITYLATVLFLLTWFFLRSVILGTYKSPKYSEKFKKISSSFHRSIGRNQR